MLRDEIELMRIQLHDVLVFDVVRLVYVLHEDIAGMLFGIDDPK
jgi:hypothetical protein